MAKKKIAVLGGGMSALTSVYEITNQPDWDKNYDITVYQLGWRLGGKGASGRNQSENDRIEEHGLHIWFGFYDNAFRLIRDCYSKLGRSLDKPLATWEEAFQPHSFGTVEEFIDGKWEYWNVTMPTNGKTPGDPAAPPKLAEIMQAAFRLGLSNFRQLEDAHSKQNFQLDHLDSDSFGLMSKAVKDNKLKVSSDSFGLGSSILDVLEQLFEKMLTIGEGAFGVIAGQIMSLLRKATEGLWNKIADEIDGNDLLRRLWILVDLAFSNLIGMLKNNVLFRGLNVLEKYDYREFLADNGATHITVYSAPVQALYSLTFTETGVQTFSAGAALRSAICILFYYKGALYYKMQAGMGDTIFGPVYEVLKKRGVKFKFFHNVKMISTNPANNQITKIKIGKQVELKTGEYNPLFNVKGLPCWPSDPLYDQIVDGDKLKGYNLESFWTDWKDVGEVTLNVGTDFDQVILGISLKALPYITDEGFKKNVAWTKMINTLVATPTQAFQTWMFPTIAGLQWQGWKNPERALLSTYVMPIDTWADMSELIARENWPADYYPNNLGYFCGLYNAGTLPPPTDHTYPAKQKALMRQRVIDWLKQNTKYLWPATDFSGDPKGWNLLVDPKNRSGENRVDSQYFRVNVDPTEHYVLAVKNSYYARLKTNQTGYSNLFITGDWINNEFNASCIEACAMAGILCARALTGNNSIPLTQYP